MKNIKLVLATIVVLVIGFFGAKSFYENNESQRVANLSQEKGAPFIQNASYHYGKGDIVVVEYMDPQCGACAAFHPFAKRVFDEYEQELTVYVRYLDNHRSSSYVVKILEASRNQNKYQEVLAIIFQFQPQWAENNQPQKIWNYLATVPNLDLAKLRQDVATINVDDLLTQDRSDARTLGVRGTPSFFCEWQKIGESKLSRFIRFSRIRNL